MQAIRAEIVQQKCQEGAMLIDIREKMEHRREHIQGAISAPLAELEQHLAHLEPKKTLIFHCHSGIRTQNAVEKLAAFAQQNGSESFLLEGGIDGWKNAGFATTVDKSQPIDLMRQVQIAAGSLVLLGTLLGCAISPKFYLLSSFVGAGLIFAGISGFCGMARLLAKMPWNR